MAEKKIRITKANRFEDIKALLNGESVKYDTTIEIAVEFIDNELKLLAKKNGSDSAKKTEEKKVREGYKDKIVEYLMTLSDDVDGETCTQILKNVAELSEFNTQKVTPMLRDLKNEGRIDSVVKKGSTLYFAK